MGLTYILVPLLLIAHLVKIRYRIQYDVSKQWYQVCPDCWHLLAKDNPFSRYGGTWKAK